jgi:hypothetical protein
MVASSFDGTPQAFAGASEKMTNADALRAAAAARSSCGELGKARTFTVDLASVRDLGYLMMRARIKTSACIAAVFSGWQVLASSALAQVSDGVVKIGVLSNQTASTHAE